MDYYVAKQEAPPTYVARRVFPVTHLSAQARPLSPLVRENSRLNLPASSDAIAATHSGLEEGLWQMTLRSREGMDVASSPYPERPREPDCVYYMRTGVCGFGMNCRFNHPPNDKLGVTSAREKEDFPERIGLPECQYYMKRGTCKFGSTCKFHHPPERTGLAGGRVQFNFVGLPLRPGENDCAYYIRTGSCKYGLTCKFHHPQPATVGTLMMPMPGSPLYTTGSLSTSAPYQAGLPTWPVARSPYLHIPQMPGPSSYMPVIVSPQAISMPGWSTYQGAISPVPSPNGRRQALGATFVYCAGQQQTDPATVHAGGNIVSSAGTGSSASHSSMSQRDAGFPERPGQPDCHYYMKTGDCKFGAGCRYHHSKDRAMLSIPCSLSVIGLPLRPGHAACTFYIKYGICKFGPTCKFDHPVSGVAYNSSPSIFLDMQVASYPQGSSRTTTLIPASSSKKFFEVYKALDLTSVPKKPINNTLADEEAKEISSMLASRGIAATTASQSLKSKEG